MKKNVIGSTLIFILISNLVFAQTDKVEQENTVKNDEVTGLVVLWTSGEKDVFTKMVHIYTLNAKKSGWFDDITLIVWGPSAKLLSGDEELQEMITQLHDSGITLEACIWCTNQYGITEDLKELKIDVKGMGVPLSAYIKDPTKEVIVF